MVRSEDPKKINDATSQRIIVNTNANIELFSQRNLVLAGQDEDAVLTL